MIVVRTGILLICLAATKPSPPDAATLYLEAWGRIPERWTESHLPKRWPDEVDPRVAKDIQPLLPLVARLQAAAELSNCDFGPSPLQSTTTQLYPTVVPKELCALLALDGQAHFEVGEWEQGINDVITILKMSRHFGEQHRLVHRYAGLGVEAQGIDLASRYLPSFPPDQAQRLADAMDALPRWEATSHLIDAEEVAAENDACAFAHEKHPEADDARSTPLYQMMVAKIEPAFAAVRKVAALKPLQVPQALDDLDDQMAKFDPDVRKVAPAIERGWLIQTWCDEQFDMLRAACEMRIKGDAALEKSTDKLCGRPFGCTKTANGFEIRSTVVLDGVQLRLVCGAANAPRPAPGLHQARRSWEILPRP